MNSEFREGEKVPGTHFRIVARIGQGGMGSVYEVEHVELGKRFVLKALLDKFNQRQDLVQRLRNEWRSLGRLEHPNIVSIFHAGQVNGTPFYVMERLVGETLAAALQRLGRMDLPRALKVAADVLDGLQAAHEIGIVHRDVKPPNIFLTRHGAVKLLDFGIAKLTDGANNLDLTGLGIAIGTPRYMSPEQAAGERVDGRADLYALGLVLFEMLSGCGPFDGCESHEVFLAHLTRNPPRLRSLVGDVPAEVDAFVAWLLAKRAVDRPPSAGQAAAALRTMLHKYASSTDGRGAPEHEAWSRAPYLQPAVAPPAQELSPVPAAFLEGPALPQPGATGYGVVPSNGIPGGTGQANVAPNVGVPSSPPAAPVWRDRASASAPPHSVSENADGVPGNASSPALFAGEPTPGPLSNSAPPRSWERSRAPMGRGVKMGHLAAVSVVVVCGAGVAGWMAREPAAPAATPPDRMPLGLAAGYVPEETLGEQGATPQESPASSSDLEPNAPTPASERRAIATPAGRAAADGPAVTGGSAGSQRSAAPVPARERRVEHTNQKPRPTATLSRTAGEAPPLRSRPRLPSHGLPPVD